MKKQFIFKMLSVAMLIVGTIFIVACENEKSDPLSNTDTEIQDLLSDSGIDVSSLESEMSEYTPPSEPFYDSLIRQINESSKDTSMDTEKLLESILNSEHLLLVYSRNSLQEGFDWYEQHHNGLSEFMKREDATKVILESYSQKHVTENFSQKSSEEKGIFSLKLVFLETLIAQKTIIENVNSESELAKIVFEKIESKKEAPEIYSYFSNTGSTFILSRLLESENKINSLKNNEDISLFVKKGHLLNPESMDEILSHAKTTYLK